MHHFGFLFCNYISHSSSLSSSPWEATWTLSLSWITERSLFHISWSWSSHFQRFHNKGDSQSVHSTSSAIVKSITKPVVESSHTEVEKQEPLEEGEIDQSSDEKVRSGNIQNNRKLSLHQYYQRKDVPEASHKPSPVVRNNDFPKSYSHSSNNSVDKVYQSFIFRTTMF